MRCLFFWSIAIFLSRSCLDVCNTLLPLLGLICESALVSLFLFDNWCVCSEVCVAAYPPLTGSMYFWAHISQGNQSLLFHEWPRLGVHSCSNCFNIGCNCSSGIWKFLPVSILSFIFPVATLPKRWPSQTSSSRCARHLCQHSWRAIFIKSVMNPNTGSSVSKDRYYGCLKRLLTPIW